MREIDRKVCVINFQVYQRSVPVVGAFTETRSASLSRVDQRWDENDRRRLLWCTV